MSEAGLSRRARGEIADLLRVARSRGVLGPGEVEAHVDHSSSVAAAVEEVLGGREPRRFLDLGSGAGLPGLVCLACWEGSSGVLLEARERPAALLRRALAALDLEGRGAVVRERAEEAAWEDGLREAFEVVVARAFGSPSATAECATGFVEPGGLLVVTEPPAVRAERWSLGGLERLGFGAPAWQRWAGSEGRGATVMVARKERSAEGWPRRIGVPVRRPLW